MIAVRHEDLAADPLREFAVLYGKLGFPFSNRIAKRIAQMTSAKNPPDAPGNSIHCLHRDSRRLIHRWKGILPVADVQVIRSITEESAARFYSATEW